MAFSFFSVLIMSNYELSDLIMNIWGWILSILVIGSLFITLYFTLPEMFGQLKETITNCFTKKSPTIKKKSKRMKTERTKDLDKEKKNEWSTLKRDKLYLG